MKPNKQQKLLQDFTKYCLKHPEERFWQALRNWLKVDYILVAKLSLNEKDRWEDEEDTYYWQHKNK